MKTTTVASVAFFNGVNPDSVNVELEDRVTAKEVLSEKFGQNLIAYVLFDFKQTEIDGLVFRSEPFNQERTDVMTEEEFIAAAKMRQETALETIFPLVFDEMFGEKVDETLGTTEEKPTLQ